MHIFILLKRIFAQTPVVANFEKTLSYINCDFLIEKIIKHNQMTKKNIFLILITIIPYISRAENPCGVMFPSNDSTDWGIGCIYIPNEKTLKCQVANSSDFCILTNKQLRFSNDSIISINQTDIVNIQGNYINLYKVYKIIDTKYLICSNSTNKYIWLDFDEFNSKGLHFNTYKAFLQKNGNNISDEFTKINHYTNIGINISESCLNIRELNTLDSKIITCLKSNGFDSDITTHLEVVNFYDDWAYVIAREYIWDEENDESGDGCVYKIKNQYSGFLKAFDNNGRPNIWYAQSGY